MSARRRGRRRSRRVGLRRRPAQRPGRDLDRVASARRSRGSPRRSRACRRRLRVRSRRSGPARRRSRRVDPEDAEVRALGAGDRRRRSDSRRRTVGGAVGRPREQRPRAPALALRRAPAAPPRAHSARRWRRRRLGGRPAPGSSAASAASSDRSASGASTAAPAAWRAWAGAAASKRRAPGPHAATATRCDRASAIGSPRQWSRGRAGERYLPPMNEPALRPARCARPDQPDRRRPRRQRGADRRRGSTGARDAGADLVVFPSSACRLSGRGPVPEAPLRRREREPRSSGSPPRAVGIAALVGFAEPVPASRRAAPDAPALRPVHNSVAVLAGRRDRSRLPQEPAPQLRGLRRGSLLRARHRARGRRVARGRARADRSARTSGSRARPPRSRPNAGRG